MDLSRLRDELSYNNDPDTAVARRLREMCETRKTALPSKVIIVGCGPYDRSRLFGGKSHVAHMLMEKVWPDVEVEYMDLTIQRPAKDSHWDHVVFDEVCPFSVRGSITADFGVMLEREPAPTKKVHGPNNHSKHSRQGRANRWR